MMRCKLVAVSALFMLAGCINADGGDGARVRVALDAQRLVPQAPDIENSDAVNALEVTPAVSSRLGGGGRNAPTAAPAPLSGR